jgi:hypothetical protein
MMPTGHTSTLPQRIAAPRLRTKTQKQRMNAPRRHRSAPVTAPVPRPITGPQSRHARTLKPSALTRVRGVISQAERSRAQSVVARAGYRPRY